ncbi:DUF2236 domain-containing protein [Aurantimonas aggregata]|uniref:DUF2236 domain-containing protein n=1 Tax=Aurantimonas aggregata TaxID=2047720 RepID=A0A6L9MPF0_9HYPH|nr:oxygenase MpaB family protein [Aurantimonas aggregata]NDV89420.1 DUF2236 domain-containing protein [Aurantimonas aggregata]
MWNTVKELMRSPAGWEFDFSRPALAPADGVTWRVFANPVSLFIGGVAAVLLKLAEPSVRTGVSDHSSFQRDPGMRLRRTGVAAMMTIYGPRSEAEKLIARVVRMHGHVQGITPGGVDPLPTNWTVLNWSALAFTTVPAFAQQVADVTAPAEPLVLEPRQSVITSSSWSRRTLR